MTAELVAYEANDPTMAEPTVEELDAVDVMWMERLSKPFRPTERQPFRPVRCTGSVRNGPRAGRQCPLTSILGSNVCHVHGAQLPPVRKAAAARVEAARLRLYTYGDEAVDTIEDLMANSQSDAVRLKAATEVLDRIGVRGGVEVDVQVEAGVNPAQVLRDKLATTRARVIDVSPTPPADVRDTVLPAANSPDEEPQP